MKRRDFIQTSAFASAGVVVYGCGSKTAESKSTEGLLSESKTIGLQLYSLRDIIRNDVQGTMQAVAEIGYKELECYGYGDSQIFGMSYLDFNNMVKDMGMKITSGHYGLGMAAPDRPSTIVNGWEQAVEDTESIGQESMVVAYLELKERETIDQYKKVCELLNKANETCRQAGVKLQYHNHEFEFETLNGEIPYDVMLQELDPSIAMELDLYWINFAGKDPLAYFEKYPGRFEQWHVKDMSKTDRKLQADVGTGTIDFKAIFEKAELSGMKHFYIEQENYDVSEMDSIKNGYRYLQNM